MNEQINEIKSRIEGTLQKHGVRKAALFGSSVVRGELTEESDLDVLVEFKGRKSLLDLAGLKIDLEDVMKKRVDVLTYNSLHPLLRDRMRREHVQIL